MNSSIHQATAMYRDALVEGLRSTAGWRREKADQFPDDKRNVASAEALERAAGDVASLDLDHSVLIAFTELNEWVNFEPANLYTPGRSASRFGFDLLSGGIPIPYDLDALLVDILREQLASFLDEGTSGVSPEPEFIEFAAMWGVD